MGQVDWILAITLFALLVGAALYSRRYMKDVSSFIVAGRKARMWLNLSNSNSGGLGLVAIAFVAQQGYLHGFGYVWISLFTAIIASVLFGIFGFGIERFRASKAMTAGQYHEMRYSKSLRIINGIICGIGGVVNMAAFPITGALFIMHFLNWPEQCMILGYEFQTLHLLTAFMIFSAIFFAVVCGQIGVLVTDYIQGLIIMTGLFAITYLILDRTGGFANIENILAAKMGESAFNPLMEKSSYGWIWFLWVLLAGIWSPFCFGPAITKNASADNPKVVRYMTLISYLFGQGKTVIMLMLGVGAFIALGHVIPKGIDEKTYTLAATAIYIGNICPNILKGLLLAAFLAAFISTNDTYFLSWSSIWINDVINPLKKKPMSRVAHLWALRITIILIGIFLYVWGVLYKIEDTLLEYLMLTGVMWLGGGIAVVFGLYWRKANTYGAYGAVISGIVLPTIHLILQKTYPGYDIPTKLAGVVTIIVSVFLMIILSLAINVPTKFVDYGQAVRESEEKDDVFGVKLK